MKQKLLPLFCILFHFSACSPDTTVQIQRHPLIKFTYQSASWKADNYFFVGPVKVVAYPANTSQPGKLYNRFTLQAYGKDDQGNNLQLNILFDAADATQLTGTYRIAYTADKGLPQVQLFNLDNNNLAAYELCHNDSTALLQIQRQSQTEQLVSGSFQMTLCNIRDTTQKINITNGILTDIHY